MLQILHRNPPLRLSRILERMHLMMILLKRKNVANSDESDIDLENENLFESIIIRDIEGNSGLFVSEEILATFQTYLNKNVHCTAN
jgi:hypothetical protein